MESILDTTINEIRHNEERLRGRTNGLANLPRYRGLIFEEFNTQRVDPKFTVISFDGGYNGEHYIQ